MFESLSRGIGLGQKDKVIVEGFLVVDGELNHKNCSSTGLMDKRRNRMVRDTRKKSEGKIVTVEYKDQSSII